MFTSGFKDDVTEGDSITCEVDGFTIVATVERDEDSGPPWKSCDGWGVVSGWRRKDSKRPGERIINEDRGWCRFYDWEASIRQAKAEGWCQDIPGTLGERAAAACEKDFALLKAWCDDEWWYCGIVLSISVKGIPLDEHAASLWGIDCNVPDSDNKYLLEVANDLIPDALAAGKKAIQRIREAIG